MIFHLGPGTEFSAGTLDKGKTIPNWYLGHIEPG